MSLIDRYLREAERNLPRRLREDVSRELRSSIEDAVDARAGEDRGPREEVLAEVLSEYGDPVRIARSYLPDRYLIGPRYYDAFLTTTRITLLVLAGLIGLAVAAHLVGSEHTARETLWLLLETLGDLPATAATFLGIIVVVFAVVERVSQGKPPAPDAVTEWDPATLPEIEDTSRINRVSLAVDLCLYAGLFLFFNFFREYIGVLNHTNGEWWFLPIHGPDFGAHLFWLNLWWAASLATTVAVLRSDRWRPWSRVLKTALAAALAVLLFRMALDPGLAGLPPDWPDGFARVEPYQIEMAEAVAPILALILRVGLAIAGVVVSIGALRQIGRLARGRW
jgi:hypothetical protein